MDEGVEGTFGLNVVHDPPRATVDVIAVHGLGANPKYAWTRKVKDAEGEREVKWLADRDLLPAAIPTARIFTFDYQSKWHKDASSQRSSLCGTQLLDALHARRQQEKDTEYRPLVFIGHSFGGIVIEQALVDANRHNGLFLYLSLSTIGIIFLELVVISGLPLIPIVQGTPHRGTEATKWGELIATSGQLLGFGSEKTILQELKKDSPTSADLLYPFTRWLFRFSVPIVCFFEKEKTDYGKRWGFTWKELVVEERSACIDGHRKVPVQTDHFKINKFSGPNDETYRIVSTVLQEMVKGANERVQTRLNPRQIIENNSIVPEKRLECLQALFCSIDPKDARSAVHRTKGELIPGTCEWLLTQEKCSAWLVEKHWSILWLLGGPGIGKTMLSSFLVDELEKKVRMMPKAILIYFFCDDKDIYRRKDTAILRGLMLQMLRQLPSLFKHIQDDYDIQKQAMFDNFDTLWRIFLKMLEDSDGNEVYILLDALDECESLSRSNLLSAIAKLPDMSGAEARFKILVTSRPNSDMDEDATSSIYENQLRIDSAKINTDLAKFIDARVAKLPKSWPVVIIQEVKDALVNKAGGTFLWVSFVLDDIARTKLSRLVPKKLSKLPQDLNEVYDRILIRIDQESGDDAKAALEWVVGARRPLTIGELRVALGFSLKVSLQENGLPSADGIDGLEDAFKCCGNLLYHDTQTDTINLYHQSVKDYLLDKYIQNHTQLSKFSVNPERANIHIFEVCWHYLNSKEFDYGCSIIKNINGFLGSTDIIDRSKSSVTYEFLSYAVREWSEHALALQQTVLTNNQWDSFALNRSSTLRDWWLLEAAEAGQEPVVLKLLEKGANFEAKDRNKFTALMRAARGGHEAVVRLLLEKGANVEAKDYYNETALSKAAEGGHEAVVRLLLEKGACIEATDIDGKTPLIRAVKEGHEAVVRLLLEKGANIEAKDDDRRTNIHRVARIGHKAVVWLPVEKRANVEVQEKKRGETALHMAIMRGHEAVVRLLVEKGANVQVQEKERGETALHMAIIMGHEAVVRLLVEKGANVEVQEKKNRMTALYMAAVVGHEAVVRLLVDKGANVEAKDQKGVTALMRAARGGHETVVRLLVEKGADIEAKDQDGLTALIRVADGGHQAVARLLVEKGANIEAKDKWKLTALIVAVEEGHEAVVRLLLEKGANIEAKDYYGVTPVITAAARGNKDLVRLLLEKGADIEAKDNNRRTALHMAIITGHEIVAWLLLEKGADVEAKDSKGRTALITATARWNKIVARLLLEKGAEIEAKDNKGRTALIIAVAERKRTMVRLLLEKGADMEPKDNKGRTALDWATDRGDETTVQLLKLAHGMRINASMARPSP